MSVLACAMSQTLLAEQQPDLVMTEVAPASVAADELTFNVFEFQVDGNTVLNSAAIEQTVYPFMGEHKTIKEVERPGPRWRKPIRKLAI